VRLSRNRIRARVKTDLPITFSDERISAHAGLELFRRYFGAIDLAGRLREAFRGLAAEGDYGATRFVLCLVGLLLAGGRRITHLRILERDPVLLRFVGLHRLPSDRTLVRWMKRVPFAAIERLATVVRDLVYDAIDHCGFARLTIDVDGSVLRTGVRVEGAARGYNPHHPKDKSYYPLTAHLAQTGQVLRVWNRPGNVHDSHGAVEFLRILLGDLRARFGRRHRLEIRLDGAFCQPDLLHCLDREDVEYGIKLPLWQWLNLRPRIASRERWTAVDTTVSGFALWLEIPTWKMRKRVVVYRKRVSHRSRKNFQLDLFSPDDGHFEYSAVITNKTLGVAPLWHFMAGRGAHEKTLSELKQQLAFDAIPTQDRQANSLWLQLSALTHNLVRSFQLALGVSRRPNGWKRTYRYVFESLQTLRFTLIQQPARIVRPGGRAELRFTVSDLARRRIEHVQRRIERAA
jgi:Transposase DDE domain group 1